LCAGVRAEAELARTAHARRDAPGAVRALDRARELVAMLDGIAGAGSPPDALAHQALAHAELSRGEGAADPAAWEQAAARFAALGEPHQAGYARLRQAEAMLALGGERRAAARLLSSACRTATALGAAALLDDAAALARCARLSLEVDETEAPAPGPAPPMGLTPREAEVLQLVADGLSNREIGRRLFITQNTVGTHIGHIFDKLDVHTRVEAAGRAGELRPAP
jgi:DNA-binding CsgD family transcriptional regulator